jgi:hypothetical protein
VELRRAAEGKVQEVQMELEALRPKAQRMDELLGYMHTNGIAPEHLNNALGIVSMINKGDYQSALPVLEIWCNRFDMRQERYFHRIYSARCS